ncbi:ABC transporter substrate-binding protein [Desulfobacterales bacterium HSG2]|nr:ABC transporter substrate-binding protein [Desulfobacterales bacterium HSG2]
MKKLFTILLSIMLISGLVFFLYPQVSLKLKEEPYYIAVAGPMREAGGEAMLRGVELYLEKAGREGRFAGRTIELLQKDDKDQTRFAMKIASKLLMNKRVLIVLGHYSSPASLAAAESYKGVPVITASATAEGLTAFNDWYFRVVPNSRFMADFITTYLYNVMGKSSVSIIFDKDLYRPSLAENFEEAARDLGIEVKRKWGFGGESRYLDNELRKIVTELRAVEDPGAIFFATYAESSVRLITLLKYPGTNYTIIGPDSYSEEWFIDTLKEYPLERASPGYYSDGIYAVSPFIADLAKKKALDFRKEFIKKYNEEPSWVSACYYDAARVAVEAIETSDIRGNIRNDRRAIRDYLKTLNNKEVAIQGITGDIYFDEKGDVSRPLAMGFYKKQKFLPAFFQYQQRYTTDLEAEIYDPLKIVCGESVTETHVVHTGIDINEISIRHSEYTIDFYIWFRFHENFDDTNIEFANSVRPIRLEDLVMEEKTGDITTRAYHLRADFKSVFDFYAYPFDRQVLKISFRHAGKPRSSVIYIPDVLGMPGSLKERVKKIRTEANVQWYIYDMSFYQDISRVPDHRGYKTDYSQFNGTIRIKRKGVGVIFKFFFPILVMLAISYSIYFIPFDQPGIQVLIFLTVLITSIIFHILFFRTVVGDSAIKYAFFTIYALLAMAGFISIPVYHRSRQGKEKPKFLTRMGKIIHPCVVLIVGSLFIYITNKG